MTEILKALINILGFLVHLLLLIVFTLLALKFISYVITGEWKLFPKD